MRYFFLLILLTVTSWAMAQEGVVKVNSNVRIVPEAAPSDAKVQGYSVRIFSDNSQTARDSSQKIKREFESKYPNQPIEVSYDAPYFKVTVGQFLTKEEAIILWGNLLSEYSTAFVVPVTLDMSLFAKPTENLDDTFYESAF